MTVSELIDRIIAAYPGASGEAMRTFKPVFLARFGKREGEPLAAAFAATLAEFKPTTRQPFPIPADFERHMPSGTIDGIRSDEWGRERGRKLDIEGRKRRADGLFAGWRAGQCSRADKGNPMLRRALEHMARPIADTLGWDENPALLVLTRDQLKTACQAALSQERRVRHGKPPKDKHAWWWQLSSVASDWGIEITPEWWDKPTGEAFGADEIPREAQPAPLDPSAPLGAGTPPPPPRDGALLATLAAKHRAAGRIEYADKLDRDADAQGHYRPMQREEAA